MSAVDRTWLRECAIGLSERVNARGMTLSVDATETLLADRHATVTAQLGASETSAMRLLDDTVLDELADHLVADFADESPGADIFTLPRTASITAPSFGRLIAALAESILFYQQYAAIDDTDRRARLHETTQLLSLAGLLQSETEVDATTITAPPALFHRIARTLDTVATLTNDAGLATALGDDCARARAAAATQASGSEDRVIGLNEIVELSQIVAGVIDRPLTPSESARLKAAWVTARPRNLTAIAQRLDIKS